MQSVKVHNKYLWREGDKGVVVVNVSMRPEYHITPNKEYPATLTDVIPGHRAKFNYTNDAGEPTNSISDHSSDRDGYKSFWVILDRNEYNLRVNDLHTQHVNTLNDNYHQALKELEDQHSKLWKAGNP